MTGDNETFVSVASPSQPRVEVDATANLAAMRGPVIVDVVEAEELNVRRLRTVVPYRSAKAG